LTVIAAVAVVGAASAQVQYSDGQKLLKRRPFAPGGPSQGPSAVEQSDRWQPAVRGPIYSPYSMIRYEWLPPIRTIETLPTPPPVPTVDPKARKVKTPAKVETPRPMVLPPGKPIDSGR
jgi:hypothetical protein